MPVLHQLLLILHVAAREELVGIDPRVEAVVHPGEEDASLDLQGGVHRGVPVDPLLTQQLERSRPDRAPAKAQLVQRTLPGREAPMRRRRHSRVGRGGPARDELLRRHRRGDDGKRHHYRSDRGETPRDVCAHGSRSGSHSSDLPWSVQAADLHLAN